MPAPLAKGLIIAASVLVAAGIAIYESPQVRQWVDQSRRKIAIALHSLGDDIQPRRPSESHEEFEERKTRREELIRRNRNELIRRAREEGIAVDLDELARIGQEDVEMAERRQRPRARGSQKSFDDLVGADGMLRKHDDANATTATGTDSADNTVRRRGMAGFAAGSATAANPFDDSNADVLFDHDDDEAPPPKPFTYNESRESSATVEAASPASAQLIDLTPEEETAPSIQLENAQTASIPQSEADDNDTEQAAQSFYSFTSDQSLPPTHPQPLLNFDDLREEDFEAENMSTGTLTPRSEHSAFTGASVVGSQADDIAVMSMQSDEDHDARSEGFSEGGFTDAGFVSEGGYSEIGEGEREVGIMTPNSWTDVGSDDESEWGGPAQGGHISQVHQ